MSFLVVNQTDHKLSILRFDCKPDPFFWNSFASERSCPSNLKYRNECQTDQFNCKSYDREGSCPSDVNCSDKTSSLGFLLGREHSLSSVVWLPLNLHFQPFIHELWMLSCFPQDYGYNNHMNNRSNRYELIYLSTKSLLMANYQFV